MPDLMLAAVEYGGYISIVKLVAFLALFVGWLFLVKWVYRDAKAVDTNEAAWIGGLMGATAAAMVVLFVVPLFIAGALAYVVGVGTLGLVYVKHRNARVLDFDRVLTVDHIKSVIAGGSEKLEAMESFMFVTANNNEVPLPEPRTPDFFGYRTAYDLLSDAKWRRATTVMFAPTPESYEVTYSIDGVATKRPAMPKDQAEYFIRFIKSVGDLDIDEKRKPQKGKFRTCLKKENTDWELITAGSTAGEQIRLRQISKESLFRLNEIGLAPDQCEQLAGFSGIPQGLFLVTGPPKSGVTTTLYALLRNHDAFLNSINSLEKQPSAELPNITQNKFSPSDTSTTTYANKLAEIIRMGPDVVGVGECEDSDTAKVATAGAADGKVIYVVLKADSVIQALGKWIKLVGDKKQVAKTLLGIGSQRLMRKLCAECKQGYAPAKELLKKFNLPSEKAKVMYRPGKEVYDKRGKPSMCEHCQGAGFVGRTGVFETIVIGDELRRTIAKVRSLPEIGMQLRRSKMLYLQEQALRKVIAGTTAVNEMLRVLSSGKKGKG